MATFTVTRSNAALSTSSDFMTIIPASNHSLQIIEVSVGGMGTASAANELGVYRSTGGTTGGGAITPTPVGRLTSSNPPATGTVVNTTWSAQPTLGGILLGLPVNANGGIYRWVARPGEEIMCVASDEISLRAVSGSSNVTVTVVFTDDPL